MNARKLVLWLTVCVIGAVPCLSAHELLVSGSFRFDSKELLVLGLAIPLMAVWASWSAVGATHGTRVLWLYCLLLLSLSSAPLVLLGGWTLGEFSTQWTALVLLYLLASCILNKTTSSPSVIPS